MTGTYQNDVFRGWWCEAPSRKAPGDAGDVEFRFIRDDQGIRLDGKWRYGSTGPWAENWDLRLVKKPVDPALAARLNDASQFCRP